MSSWTNEGNSDLNTTGILEYLWLKHFTSRIVNIYNNEFVRIDKDAKIVQNKYMTVLDKCVFCFC